VALLQEGERDRSESVGGETVRLDR
jgi:hypothetical protein